jgi:hypothetical protein
MDCEIATSELVENARHGGALTGEQAAHVSECSACRERWVAERGLTSRLRAMRLTSVPASIEWSKAVLLREFDAHRRHERQVRWMWALSSAAVLVLSVVAVRDVWMRPVAATAVSGHSVVAQSYPLREYPQESFKPADDAGERGFIQVPFALPPAPGETFGIVRTQLDPADLARMGVSVDPAWTGMLPADILVGEDGFTQAVRLSNDNLEHDNLDQNQVERTTQGIL